MEKIVMWIMALGALAGGLDRIFGGRLGLGQKFEQGFMLLGPTALSMAGIVCLVPLVSGFLGSTLAPLCMKIGVDPSVFAGLLAIDMGGYQLAMDLSGGISGRFSGIVIAATLGCTVSFTIPIGMGMLKENARSDFAHGIIFGLIAMPVGLIAGGWMCGMHTMQVLKLCLPVLLFSFILLIGIWKRTELMIRVFSVFAKCISIAATFGLMLEAFRCMTGVAIIPGLAPIEDAMDIVASIGIVMLGSLPAAELLQRALKKPLAWFGMKTGMNSASAAGLLIGMVSVLPAIVLIKDMDRRGRIVNAAFMVCAASAFAAHIGFAAGVDSAMIPALLASKFSGGIVGAAIALLATRKKSAREIL